MNEDQYKQELQANGVDIPELNETETKETETETKTEESSDEKEGSKDETETKKETKDEDQSIKKRSIYDEYKDKKKDLKVAEERATRAEQERDEALKKLQDATKNATTSEEKADAQDELEAYAEEQGLDAAGLRKLKTILLKDIPVTSLSEEDKNALANIKEFSKKNQEVVEKQQFDDEFKSITPTLQEFFPNLNETEKENIKNKLDELAHTEQYHDKELDYILFKEKENLKSIVSPKKRGLESKQSQDQQVSSNFTFDPNADYSTMTPSERIEWEKGYNKATRSDGLATDSQGRKILI